MFTRSAIGARWFIAAQRRQRVGRPEVVGQALEQPGRIRQPHRLALETGARPQPGVLVDDAAELEPLAAAGPLAQPQPRQLRLGGGQRHPLAQLEDQQLELVAHHRRQVVGQPGQRLDDRVEPPIHADETVHRLGDAAPVAARQLAVRPEARAMMSVANPHSARASAAISSVSARSRWI